MPDNDTPNATPTDLQVLTPGEVALDQNLLDEAVGTIRTLYATKGMDLVIEIGTYVLDTFFGGDAGAFHERGGEHATFRSLAHHEDMPVSFSWIYKAVAVVDQLRLLPEATRQALPFSHHVALLPIRDAKKKARLAERAMASNWPKRKLEDEVKKIRDQEKDGRRVGRPPLPAFVKGFRQLTKAVDYAESEVVTDEVFATYRPEDARELLVQVDVAMERLGKIRADVSRAMLEFESRTGGGEEE